MASQYEYAGYPPSYESTQIPQQQQPLRPMRSGSSHSPHPQPQFNPSTQSNSPYQSAPTYAPSPYGMTQPTPQWSSDNWTHYNQSFQPPPPPAPIPDVPFNSGPGRPEAVSAVLADQRAYPSQPNPEPRRNEDRLMMPSAPAGPILPTKTKRKDRESPPTAGLPGTPPGLDFMKLLDSYRLIIDSSGELSNSTSALPMQGRSPPAETVERMLQSAIYGVQLLESANMQPTHMQPTHTQPAHMQPAPVPDTRPPADRDGEDAKEPSNGSASSSKRQKTEDSTVIEGQTCLGCKATSTPEWRRGPMGPRTLCNACGLVYAKLIKKRVREGVFGKTNGQGIPGSQGLGDESGLASSGDGGSDDEDSYGSQDRRSEVGGT